MNNSVFFHMLIIFGSLFLLILLAIFIPLIFMIRKTNQQRRDREWLQQHGTRITASVKYVILQGGEDSEPRSDPVQGVGLLIDALGDASPRQIAYDERQLSRPRSSSTRRYQITAQWVHLSTRESYIFQQTVSSTTLPKGYDPLSLSEVTVLIDPGNSKRYYIELPSSP